MTRPSDLPRWADASPSTSRTTPPEGVKDTGWLVNSQPPAGWLNWLQGIAGDWVSYLAGRVLAAGIVVTDAVDLRILGNATTGLESKNAAGTLQPVSCSTLLAGTKIKPTSEYDVEISATFVAAKIATNGGFAIPWSCGLAALTSDALTSDRIDRCIVRRVASQTVPTDTPTAIVPDTEDLDTNALWTTPNAYLAVHKAGTYHVEVDVNLALGGDAVAGFPVVALMHGATEIGRVPYLVTQFYGHLSAHVQCANGDHLSVVVTPTAGAGNTIEAARMSASLVALS